MFSVQTATPAEVTASNAEVQSRSLSSNLLVFIPRLQEGVTGGVRKSVFQFVSTNPVSEEMRQTMEDFHRYVDLHRDQLALQYLEREATRLAQEKDLKENPPQPQDTVIQYFPIRNQPTTGLGANQ